MERKDPPRVERADRRQVQLRAFDLESTLAEEHPARSIWDAVEGLDLSGLHDVTAARGSSPGQPAIDPQILVALWLYATSEGVGSARELSRLCERDDAYRWLCGGVSVDPHTLRDFRVGNGASLDDLLAQVIAVLTHHKLIKLKRVAHPGMRVRASAGGSSFRQRKTLAVCATEAAHQVDALKRELDEPATSPEAAAREREAAVARALAELPKLEVSETPNPRSERNRRRKQRRTTGASKHDGS